VVVVNLNEMVDRRDFVLPSVPESREVVERAVMEALERRRCPEEVLFAVRLALEEAVVNAIRHGNKLDPEKKIFVSYLVEDARITVSVEDEGPGFDLDSVPDPTAEENLEADHGRGILLMRVYMDEVVYNERGNKVTLTKMGIV
jgi:serine/threonine-protein kinase RsbW